MGVAKLSKSKKQLQFITDDGEIYVCSAKSMAGLVYGSFPILRLNKFAQKTDPDRFPKSEIYGTVVDNKMKDSLTKDSEKKFKQYNNYNTEVEDW